ncbi:MAG: 5-formyltetrahydrofolate cyclo-ligase [Desulfobacterales bacterium]|nr:5-formyltetrahydrofolate cyclo-ligase [Desulfobacterales bacterium]MCP4162258.1 5-formyltetrahydrofolate cyclo-ligase [Deltaproteobacteria bacterium]
MDNGGEKRVDFIDNIIKKVEGLSKEQLAEKTAAIEERLFDFANFLEAQTALLYVPRNYEVDTTGIINRSLNTKKSIVLPSISTELQINSMFKITNLEANLIPSYNGLKVPDPAKCKSVNLNDINIAIIPGICFDEKGGRVGTGDKYYNKFIPKLSSTIRKVALCFEEQLVQQVPSEFRNKNLDIIITDKRIVYKI